MGCCSSKSPVKGTPATGASKPSDNHAGALARDSKAASVTLSTAVASPQNLEQQSLDPFLRTFLKEADDFFDALQDEAVVKHAVAVSFANSCAEVCRNKCRAKFDAVRDAIAKLCDELKLRQIPTALSELVERSSDDGFAMLLQSWDANNPGATRTIPAKCGQSILDAMKIRFEVVKPVDFKEVLTLYFRWATFGSVTAELFVKLAEGNPTMNLDQLARFLRESQRAESLGDRQVEEKLRTHFGGALCKYNFCSFMGSLSTNCVFVPDRTTSVWQDMTQPLPHYVVSTVRILSEGDLHRAIEENARAFVVEVSQDASGRLVSGSCSIEKIAATINAEGFAKSIFPIILCLSPSAKPSVEIQDALAELLVAQLGDTLARGLMFEGATLHDPKFSPAALQRKVLLLGHQAALKPMVGIFAADMNRNGLGVRLTDIADGTPAAKSGLLKDDWLTHINGEPIGNLKNLRGQLSKLSLGDQFTLKRENLEEIKVVVGGTVDPNDASASTALSKLMFLKFSDSEAPKPWETRVLGGNIQAAQSLTRRELGEFMAYVPVDRQESNVPVLEGVASTMGVQLVDSPDGLLWSYGRFLENGHCGYMLKSDLETRCNYTISVIAGPRLHGGPELVTGSAIIVGSGTARRSGNTFTLSDCDDSSVVILELMFEKNGAEHWYVASFAPLLLREGYRAVPVFPKGDVSSAGKRVQGVFCLIKKQTS